MTEAETETGWLTTSSGKQNLWGFCHRITLPVHTFWIFKIKLAAVFDIISSSDKYLSANYDNTAAATAKWPQSCPTLCDPINGRLPRPWDSPDKNTGVRCHCLLQCMKVKSESEVAQSCPTPSDPMDCSPPGPSIHGIFQARVLEWVSIAFSSQIPETSFKPTCAFPCKI